LIVETAKTAGFCFGVNRAVNMALAVEKGSATLGQIIHNKHVMARLHRLGIGEIDCPEAAAAGQRVLIPSHGAPPEVYERLTAAGAEYIDATCPFVKRIDDIVREASEKGRFVIIIGDKGHTEVTGITGWVTTGRVTVCEDEQMLSEWIDCGEIARETPVTVVSQTTMARNTWDNCVKIIKKEYTNHEIFDTICSATASRQEEAERMARECDAMIVVGDKQSANTVRLFHLCSRFCPYVTLVESADDIQPHAFNKVYKVGIVAGASTPKWIIEEVSHLMNEDIKNIEAEETESINNTPVSADSETFEELLMRSESLRTINNGDKVKGIIVGMSNTEIQVDLGTKHSGYIPVSEISDDPTVKADALFKVGDEVEAIVIRVNDVEGTAMLSKKRLDSSRGWEVVEAANDNYDTLDGYIVEENKGGLVAMVKGVRVFIPSSQTGIPKDSPLTPLVKTNVKLKITEVNRARRRVVGSIRAVQNEQRRANSEKVWEEIEVGKIYSGVVKSLTSYGVFVDIGGVDGMVHISELSWKRIHNPAEVVAIGDKVEVYVISFDPEKKKISLGLRKPEDNPWAKFMAAYNVDDVITAKVVKLMPFGAFAEIIPGVDGLIHISQIANRRIGKPGDVLTEGEEVVCKITNIDPEKQKVWISIRAVIESVAPFDEASQGSDLEDSLVAVSEEGVLEIPEDSSTSDAE